MRDLYRNLDFAAYDNYPGFFAMSAGDGTDIPSQALVPTIALGHDLMRCARDGKPFLVMEEQSGKAGQPVFSPQPEPGQIRLWSYQAVAHGAMGINYFRWDTTNFGAEEYWHGMLRHDRSHSPAFDEMLQTFRELKSLGPDALHAPCEASIALCYDLASSWALSIQPGQPKLRYLNEIISWYGAVRATQAGVDLVPATQDLSRYKVLCAPVMYVVSAQQAETIRRFVEGGGVFIAGFRLGVKDEHSRIVDTPLPGLLRDVMGVELLDDQPLYSEKQGVSFTGPLTGPAAPCHIWADILEPQKTEVLATYTEGAYAGKAAITANSFGKGKAVYLGAHLEPADLGRVLGIFLASAGIKPIAEVKTGVEVTRRSAGGRTWTYLLNHSSAPQTVSIEGVYRDALKRSPISGAIGLEPYGVRVLMQG
jgi:beta-galactosidase